MSSLREHIVALVHADARAYPIERARHSCFIATRLAGSFALLALVPPLLIYLGVPTGWAALALAWLLIPPASVVLAVRTGRLGLAQTLSMAGVTGAAVALFEADPSNVAVLAWLPVLPLEAMILERPGAVPLACGASLLLLAILLLAPNAQAVLAPSASGIAFVVPPLLYATGLALGLRYVEEAKNSVRTAIELEAGALIELAGEGVLHMDRHGAVVSAAGGIEALLGVGPHALRGRGLFERINVADRPAYLKAVADAANSSTSLLVRLRLRKTPRENGTWDESPFCNVEMRLTRHCTGGSETSDEAHVIAALRKIGEENRPDVGSATVRTEAVPQDLWKDRFLAIVSHELRTPLNAIIGFSEMLSSPEFTPQDQAKQREYAEIINTSGQHLLAVVNSILDVSKIEAGHFDIVPESFHVASLIDATCDMVRLKAAHGDLQLMRACEPGLPELIADKRACRQILINLLSNAIKFTPPAGRITVGARREGPDCVLSVSDTGVGIKARDLPRLGAPFFQAQGDYDRRYEGTGLGLSVVRGLVGLHGGTIAVTSAPGAGTSVEVRLPFEGPRPLGRTAGGVARIETGHRPGTGQVEPAEPTKVKKIA